MTILLQLLKLIVPLLKEYGISNLRLKRGGGKSIVLLATGAAFIVLTMFIAYAVEQASTNLRLHEPMARQYQALERNNQRLSEQLEEAKAAAHTCDVFMQELKGKYPVDTEEKPAVQTSKYDPETKVMVPVGESATDNL